jgi:hypothetical protein
VYDVARQKIDLDTVASIATHQSALNKRLAEFNAVTIMHQLEIDRLQRDIKKRNDDAAANREKLITRLFDLDEKIEEAFRTTPPGAEFCVKFEIGIGIWSCVPTIEHIRDKFPGAVELLTKARNVLHMHQLSTTLGIEPNVRGYCTDAVEKFSEWRGGTHLVLRCNLPTVPPPSTADNT